MVLSYGKRVKTANLMKHHRDDIFFMLTADIDFFSGNIIYNRSTSFRQNCTSKKEKNEKITIFANFLIKILRSVARSWRAFLQMGVYFSILSAHRFLFRFVKDNLSNVVLAHPFQESCKSRLFF